MIRRVKKVLLIVLLLVLPLQFGWAAAAAYCQHEKEHPANHFGHHSHQHQAKADKADDDGQPRKAHSDCAYCHFACQAPLQAMQLDLVFPSGSTYTVPPPFSYSSHLPDGPKRPDWRLAA